MAESGGQTASPDPQRNARNLCAELYAAGTSVADIAGVIEIPERTVYHWLRTDEVKERVREIRSAVFGRAVGLLTGQLVEATEAVKGLMASADERVRLAATRLHFESCLKLRAFEEYEDRLRSLETWREQATGGKREGATA